MTHSDECQANQDRIEAARAAWRERWPNHCRTCEGTGGALGEDACPDCMDSDRCPRCGREGAWISEEGPCLSCGWDWEDGPDDTIPAAFNPSECPCSIEAAYQAELECERMGALWREEKFNEPDTEPTPEEEYAADLAFDAARERRGRR